MRAFQVIIKFFALCLAGVIIIAMFAAIVGAFGLVGRIVGGNDGVISETMDTLWESSSTDASKITKLELKIGATSTKMIYTNEPNFRLETNNKYISSRQVGNTLYIEEESHFAFSEWFEDGDLLIYVPKQINFRDVKIDVGAGSFVAEEIVTDSIDLEVGAGKTRIDNLIAREDTRIHGGAGSIEINGGVVNDLHLELGAGKTAMRAEISGNSKVDTGVGKLDLTLLGGKSRYKFTVDKGIGSVRIDGVSQNDDAVYGQGSNLIELESGIGAVEVQFAE